MNWQPLLALPARLLAPLMLIVLALLLSGAHNFLELRNLQETIEAQVAQRVRDRLAVEQGRLEALLGLDNEFEMRRLVSGLALMDSVTHAWLVDGGSRVVAGFSRLEIDQPLVAVLTGQTAALRQAALEAMRKKITVTQIHRILGEPALLAQVTIKPDHRLLLRIDLSKPLAVAKYEARGELWRKVAEFIVLAAVLAILLHVLWFRRTARLTAAVAELGAGRLDARARLAGRDELAGIGAAIDRMADELQARQNQLQLLESLVTHSPVVIITWRNLPNRPVTYVSENIRQWGYSPADLMSGKLQYADLIHHADLPRLDIDVAEHHAHGPDEYRQEYRLRHADGHWLWIVDRTWLTRDANGAVTNIAGALTDISDRHRLEEAQRQQSAILSERNEELERFNRAMVGRELDMIRLKQQVNELSQQLGREPPYAANLTDPIVPTQVPPMGISRAKGRGA